MNEMEGDDAVGCYELRVNCVSLPKFDVGSNTDPFLCVSVHWEDTWVPLARSEVIENNNNPAFVTPFLVPKTHVHDYDPVPIRFAVYDSDDARDELIGAVETTVAHLLRAQRATQGKTSLPILPVAESDAGKRELEDRRRAHNFDGNDYLTNKERKLMLRKGAFRHRDNAGTIEIHVEAVPAYACDPAEFKKSLRGIQARLRTLVARNTLENRLFVAAEGQSFREWKKKPEDDISYKMEVTIECDDPAYLRDAFGSSYSNPSFVLHTHGRGSDRGADAPEEGKEQDFQWSSGSATRTVTFDVGTLRSLLGSSSQEDQRRLLTFRFHPITRRNPGRHLHAATVDTSWAELLSASASGGALPARYDREQREKLESLRYPTASPFRITRIRITNSRMGLNGRGGPLANDFYAWESYRWSLIETMRSREKPHFVLAPLLETHRAAWDADKRTEDTLFNTRGGLSFDAWCEGHLAVKLEFYFLDIPAGNQPVGLRVEWLHHGSDGSHDNDHSKVTRVQSPGKPTGYFDFREPVGRGNRREDDIRSLCLPAQVLCGNKDDKGLYDRVLRIHFLDSGRRDIGHFDSTVRIMIESDFKSWEPLMSKKNLRMAVSARASMFKMEPLELCDHYGQSTACLFDGRNMTLGQRKAVVRQNTDMYRPLALRGEYAFYQHCVRKNKGATIPATDMKHTLVWEQWETLRNKKAAEADVLPFETWCEGIDGLRATFTLSDAVPPSGPGGPLEELSRAMKTKISRTCIIDLFNVNRTKISPPDYCSHHCRASNVSFHLGEAKFISVRELCGNDADRAIVIRATFPKSDAHPPQPGSGTRAENMTLYGYTSLKEMTGVTGDGLAAAANNVGSSFTLALHPSTAEVMADLGVHVPRYTIDLILQPLRLDPMSEESHPLTRNTNSGHKVKDLLAMRCEYQAYQADRIRRRKGQVVGQWLKLKTWQLHLRQLENTHSKQMNACLLARQSAAAMATPLTSLAHAMPSYSKGGAPFLGLQLTISCRGLDNKDGFGGISDPFFKISIIASKNVSSIYDSWGTRPGLKEIFRSRTKTRTLNPEWSPCLLPLHENVCGFEHQVDRLLLVQVFDYDSVTDHDLIGEFTTSVQDLLTRHTERATASVEYPLVNTKKWAKETSRGKHYVHSGIMSIKVQEMKGLERPHFPASAPECCVGHNWCASSEPVERKGLCDWYLHRARQCGAQLLSRANAWATLPMHQDYVAKKEAERERWFQAAEGLDYDEWKKGVPSLLIDMSAKNIDNKDGFMGKSDPYVKVSWVTCTATGEIALRNEVWRSKIIMRSLQPDWSAVKIPLEKLHPKGLDDRALLFEVFDYDAGNADDLIGSFETSVRELLSRRNDMPAYTRLLINPSKKARKIGKGKFYEHSGIFRFDNVEATLLDRLSKEVGGVNFRRHSSKEARMKSMLRTATGPELQYLGEYAHYREERIKFGKTLADNSGAWTSLTALRRKMNELDAQRDAWFQKGGGMTYEEWRRGVPSLAVKIRAKGLDNKDGPLSASDPYFKISHIPSHFKDYRKCSRPIEVFRSKTIKNNLAPNWKTVSMNLHDLYRTHGVNVDPDRLLVFSVWDLDVGGDDLIGECVTSVRDLTQHFRGDRGESKDSSSLSATADVAGGSKRWDLINESKRRRKRSKGKFYDNSGVLIIESAEMSFIDRLSKNNSSLDAGPNKGKHRSPSENHYKGEYLWWVELCIEKGKRGQHVTDGNKGQQSMLQLESFREFARAEEKRRQIAFAKIGGLSFDDWAKGEPAIHLDFSASGLDNTDGWFSKSDPYVQISWVRGLTKNKWYHPKHAERATTVWKGKHVKRSLNPNWKACEIPLRTLYPGDRADCALLIEIFDYDSASANDLIGGCETSVAELLELHSRGQVPSFPLINPEKQMDWASQGKHYENSGILRVDVAKKTMLDRLSKEVGSQTAKRRSSKLFASLRSATTDAEKHKQLRGEYDFYCDSFAADKAQDSLKARDCYDLERLRQEIEIDKRQRNEWFVKGGGIPFASWRKGVPSLNLTVRASNLTNTDGVFGKSDPYFKISHCQIKAGGNSTVDVDYRNWPHIVEKFRSKTISSNLNPAWGQVTIPNSLLYDRDDPTRLLLVQVYDEDIGADDDLIGEFVISVASLLSHFGDDGSGGQGGGSGESKVSQSPSSKRRGSNEGPLTFGLMNEKEKRERAQKGKFYENSGLFVVERAEISLIDRLHKDNSEMCGPNHGVRNPKEHSYLGEFAWFELECIKRGRDRNSGRGKTGQPCLQLPDFVRSEIKRKKVADDQFKARGGMLWDEWSADVPCLDIHLSGRGMDKKDSGLFAKSDPFIEMYVLRAMKQQKPPPLLVTKVRKRTLNPDWGVVKIPTRYLNFDIGPEDCLLFRCLDQDNDGTTDDIGTAATSLSELRARTKSSRPLLLINDNVKAFKSRKGEMYTDSGKIFTAFKADGYVTRLELYASECKLNNISLRKKPKGQSDEAYLRGLYAKYRFDYKQPLGLDTTVPFTTLAQYRAIRGSKISDASKAKEAETIRWGGLGYHDWCAYECMRFQLEGQGLDDSMGCDAYLRLSWITEISWNSDKQRYDMTTDKIWENRSDYKTSTDPVWEPFTLTREMFLRGGNHLVLLEVYDYDRFSRDDLIGQKVLTINALYSLKAGDRLELEHPRRRRRLHAKGENGLVYTSGVVLVKAATKQSGTELTERPKGCSTSVWRRLQSADAAVCYEQYQHRIGEKHKDRLGLPPTLTIEKWEQFCAEERWQLEYLHGEMDGIELSFSYKHAKSCDAFGANIIDSFERTFQGKISGTGSYANISPVASVPHRVSKSFETRDGTTPEMLSPIDYPFDKHSFGQSHNRLPWFKDPISSCFLDQADHDRRLGDLFVPLDISRGGLPDGNCAIVLSFVNTKSDCLPTTCYSNTYVLSAVTSVNELLRMKRGHELTFVAGAFDPDTPGKHEMVFSKALDTAASTVTLSLKSARRVRRARWSKAALTLDEVKMEYRAFILKQKELLANRTAHYWHEHGTIDLEGLKETQTFYRRQRDAHLAKIKADREEAARQQKIKEKNDRAEARRAAAEASAMRKKREKQRAKEAKEQRARDKAAQRERREREAREAKAQEARARQREAERIAKLKRDEPIHRRWEAEARAIVQPLMIRTRELLFHMSAFDIKFRWTDIPDPYVVVQKVIDGDDEVVTIATSETKNDDRNPHWKPLSVKPFSLCGGDLDARIRLDVFDYSKSKKHKLVGKYVTSLRALLSTGRARTNERTYRLASEDRNRFSCRLNVSIWCDRKTADKCGQELKRAGLLPPGSRWRMEQAPLGGYTGWCDTGVSLRNHADDFEWFARKVRQEGRKNQRSSGESKSGDGTAQAVARNGKQLLDKAFG